MKTKTIPLLLAASFLWLADFSAAQDAVFVAPQQGRAPAEKGEEERPAETPRARNIQGIVGQILRSLNPLQLINPFAPSYYGTGEQNVSDDESFAKPYVSQPGLVVFGVEEK